MDIFSCASAKAERSLSSLYGMFLYVELGDPPPPGQDFMGPDQNATPLLYDSKSAHDQKDPPSPAKLMGAYGNATPILKPIFFDCRFDLT